MRMKKTYKAFKIFAITVIGCAFFAACSTDSGSNSDSGSNAGQGGSMARFTINGDILYTVDNQSLNVFNVATAESPVHLVAKTQSVGFNIETIFTQNNDTLLFIGAQDGMYIYDIKDKERPKRLAKADHLRSCDPVVRYGNYAYVTLNSKNWWCGNASNVLKIYDITDPTKPKELKTIPLINPRGLGVDAAAKKLFVCDKYMKIYDITNPADPDWVDDFDHLEEAATIDLYDVIPANGTLFTIGNDGLYQFDYTGPKVDFLSKIPVKKD